MLHCGLNLTSDFKPFISNYGINTFFFFLTVVGFSASASKERYFFFQYYWC